MSLLMFVPIVASQQTSTDGIGLSNSMLSMLSFKNFKLLHEKRYLNPIEDLSRAKTYLANALRSFLSFVSFKHKQSSSYLAINSMSDKSFEEIVKKGLQGGLRSVKRIQSGEGRKGFKLINQKRADLDLEDIKQQASDLLDRNDNFYTRESLVDEPVVQSIQINDRGAISASRSLKSYQSIGLEVTPELRDSPSEHSWLRNILVRVATQALNSSASKYLIDSVQSLMDQLEQAVGAEDFYDAPDSFEDKTYVDHRDCLTPVRNQRDCGCCYAFATIALYEWAFCQLDKQRCSSFSEQYMVDCGNNFGLDGCSGGDIIGSNKFVRKMGVERLESYPYRESVQPCSSEHSEFSRSSIKTIREFKTIYMEELDFEKYLEKSPIVVGVATEPYFYQYGGGVDRARDCSDRYGHAMLLVGHGRLDGQRYWLLRNSMGPDWGNKGYYMMSRESRCILDGFGVGLKRKSRNIATLAVVAEVDQPARGRELEPVSKR